MAAGSIAYPNALVTPLYITDFIPFFTTPAFKQPEFLHREYIEKSRTVQEIATEIGSSKSTVLKHLREFGIAVREVGAPQRRKRGLAYGKRVVARVQVDHKQELETIEKIKQLRAKGFSYWKIADALNTLGVKTKTRNSIWHATTVMGILKRDDP